jgi:hypothetical protein
LRRRDECLVKEESLELLGVVPLIRAGPLTFGGKKTCKVPMTKAITVDHY